MIIDEFIKIKINPSNYKRYISLGYIYNKMGEEIEIKVSDLSNGSHVKINVKCSICNNIKSVVYSNYINHKKHNGYTCFDCNNISKNIERVYKVSNARSIEGINEKIEKTNIEKYGVKSVLCLKEIRNLVKDIYGVDNISKLDKIKEIKRLNSQNKYNTNTPLQDKNIIKIIRDKHLKSGLWKEYDKNDYKKYRYRVNYLTKKNKKQLFENWDGYDFYDNEYIKDYLTLNNNNSNYPSIDHKVPAIYGFLHNIIPEEISGIENLCITKRFINSSKFSLSVEEFINK